MNFETIFLNWNYISVFHIFKLCVFLPRASSCAMWSEQTHKNFYDSLFVCLQRRFQPCQISKIVFFAKIVNGMTRKTPERRQWRLSGVSIVNFEHISHLVLVFLSLTLNRKMPAGIWIYLFISISLCCYVSFSLEKIGSTISKDVNARIF